MKCLLKARACLFQNSQRFHTRMNEERKEGLTLLFENTIRKHFELDPNPSNNASRQVKGFCFSRVTPTPLDNPRIGALSSSALKLIGLDAKDITVSEESKKRFAEYMCGNSLMPGSEPFSHNYCGHQFGYFAGQLGDGRAISIGDVLHEGRRWEVQLKGAGKTPYSRKADGRAVLRSSIREFLCSEAMHYLSKHLFILKH